MSSPAPAPAPAPHTNMNMSTPAGGDVSFEVNTSLNTTTQLKTQPQGADGAAGDAGGGGAGFSPVRVGVCTMDKKATSKPMVAILTRLNLFADFHITTFGDDLILNKPVSCWPEVDCLISFFSEGFPLDKAEAYVRQERGKNPNFMCLNGSSRQ